MNMNTPRLDDKFNGLLLAALAAIVLCAGLSDIRDELYVMAGASAQILAQASTPAARLRGRIWQGSGLRA